MASELILNLDNHSFDTTVKSITNTILVDFWAPWCGPCKAISPILDELATELKGKVTIVKVNVDDNQEIAEKFSIQALPTLVIIKNGTVIERLVGSKSKTELMAKLT